MEACLSIKFAYLDWLTCKKCLLGGHGKARRTVRTELVSHALVNGKTTDPLETQEPIKFQLRT